VLPIQSFPLIVTTSENSNIRHRQAYLADPQLAYEQLLTHSRSSHVTLQGVDAVTDPNGVDDVTAPMSEIGTTAAWETSCAACEGTNATTRRAL
jgi:hypothetical protein